jgi:hypothetical protein
MAQTKGNIENAPGVDEKDDKFVAVESVTEETPHPADESSAAGPYDGLEVNRPPVSTNRPDVPIAHSLVEGAGAPTGEPDIHPETYVADNAYVSDADKDNMADDQPAKRGPGRPKKEES